MASSAKETVPEMLAALPPSISSPFVSNHQEPLHLVRLTTPSHLPQLTALALELVEVTIHPNSFAAMTQLRQLRLRGCGLAPSCVS